MNRRRIITFLKRSLVGRPGGMTYGWATDSYVLCFNDMVARLDWLLVSRRVGIAIHA
jgi:hypothetical protein